MSAEQQERQSGSYFFLIFKLLYLLSLNVLLTITQHSDFDFGISKNSVKGHATQHAKTSKFQAQDFHIWQWGIQDFLIQEVSARLGWQAIWSAKHLAMGATLSNTSHSCHTTSPINFFKSVSSSKLFNWLGYSCFITMHTQCFHYFQKNWRSIP